MEERVRELNAQKAETNAPKTTVRSLVFVESVNLILQ